MLFKIIGLSFNFFGTILFAFGIRVNKEGVQMFTRNERRNKLN